MYVQIISIIETSVNFLWLILIAFIAFYIENSVKRVVTPVWVPNDHAAVGGFCQNRLVWKQEIFELIRLKMWIIINKI